ncbi:septation protein SpoVG family protein [Robinsoniella peoriensis]|uniref:septation protein SpoVG family protein n=1 Tax=Robinsoniella peoriensis TaxID=180332 RepID=UPI00364453AD
MSTEKTTVPQETEPQPEQAALPLKLGVTARLIEPKGNLVGFASLKLNDCFVIDDFKILQNDKGIFVGMPSKPDKTSKTGYRDTARPITKEFRAELTEAVTAAYHAEFEKLQTRAAAIASPEKQSIPKQLAEGAKQAAQENAARSATAKASKAKNAER